MSGVKKDNGKVRPSLVLSDMPRALLAVAEVATFGAEKYSDGNWLHVDNALSRYTDAKDRHRLQGGIEAHDSESGLLHAAHEAWNALAVLELMIRDSERVTNNWPESADARIDIIGANGNDGDHYNEFDMSNPANWRLGDLLEYVGGARNEHTKGSTYELVGVYGGMYQITCDVEAIVNWHPYALDNFKWHSRPTNT